jgi:hypothetical protein
MRAAEAEVLHDSHLSLPDKTLVQLPGENTAQAKVQSRTIASALTRGGADTSLARDSGAEPSSHRHKVGGNEIGSGVKMRPNQRQSVGNLESGPLGMRRQVSWSAGAMLQPSAAGSHASRSTPSAWLTEAKAQAWLAHSKRRLSRCGLARFWIPCHPGSSPPPQAAHPQPRCSNRTRDGS